MDLAFSVVNNCARTRIRSANVLPFQGGLGYAAFLGLKPQAESGES